MYRDREGNTRSLIARNIKRAKKSLDSYLTSYSCSKNVYFVSFRMSTLEVCWRAGWRSTSKNKGARVNKCWRIGWGGEKLFHPLGFHLCEGGSPVGQWTSCWVTLSYSFYYVESHQSYEWSISLDTRTTGHNEHSMNHLTTLHRHWTVLLSLTLQ